MTQEQEGLLIDLDDIHTCSQQNSFMLVFAPMEQDENKSDPILASLVHNISHFQLS